MWNLEKLFFHGEITQNESGNTCMYFYRLIIMIIIIVQKDKNREKNCSKVNFGVKFIKYQLFYHTM